MNHNDENQVLKERRRLVDDAFDQLLKHDEASSSHLRQYSLSKGKIHIYYTKEEVDERIKELMDGPEVYMMEENDTRIVAVSRREMIEDVKKRIRS